MDRSEVFYQFMEKHPQAEEQVFDLGKQTVGEIRLGMFHDVVEEIFVAAYYKDGKCRLEQRIQEPDLSAAIGSMRVLPDAAISLGLSHLKSFVG